MVCLCAYTKPLKQTKINQPAIWVKDLVKKNKIIYLTLKPIVFHYPHSKSVRLYVIHGTQKNIFCRTLKLLFSKNTVTGVCKAPKNTKCFRIWINSLTFIQFSTCSKEEMVKIILKGLVHQKMKIVINYFTLMSIQTRKTFFRTQIKICLRWPRVLNVLQLQRTHANRKSTSKSRKHL